MIGKITVPSSDRGIFKKENASFIKSRIKYINNKYGAFIENSSQISRVPSLLISSFIFLESNGDELANSSTCAKGLMQIMPGSASDILIMENRFGRLNEREIEILVKYLGFMRVDFLLNNSLAYGTKVINKEELLIPELNILIGSMYLGILIDESTENGIVRLDKVVTRYNAGYYSYSKGKRLIGTSDNIVDTVNTESSNYILKLIGKNGVLDVMLEK